MYRVELYGRVRRAVHVEGMSTREASRVFGLHRDTVRKMLRYSVPPGYRRERPPRRPKLDPYKGVIDRILEDDQSLPKKQRHTGKRIYDRLRDEHGFPGKYTIVKDYVRERRRQTREMFVPLSHPPCSRGPRIHNRFQDRGMLLLFYRKEPLLCLGTGVSVEPGRRRGRGDD